MDEADALRENGDLVGAMEKYAVAHDILRVPTTGLELASVQAQLGLLVEARMTATDTSRLIVKKDEPAIYADSRRDAAKLAAELEPRVPALTLTVTPRVPYRLWIDGMEVPEHAQGLRFRTNPGEHVVEVTAEGYQPATHHVVLAEGMNQLLNIALTPQSADIAAAPAPPPEVPAVPEAPEPAPQPEPIAKPEAEAPAPPPTAVASAPAAEAPPPAPVAAPLEAEPPAETDPLAAQRLRGYIGIVAGGVVLLGGAVSGIVSLAETSSAKQACAGDLCPGRLRDKLATADTLANVANVAVPIGLLGIAYGLYEMLTLPAAEEPRASRFGMQVGAGGAVVTLRGAL